MSQELVNSVNKLTDETSALLQEYVKGNTVLQNSASEAASSAAAAKVSEGITIDKANVATQKAAEAKQFRDETAAVATGGTATLDPTPGKIPLANAEAKIHAGWLPVNVSSLSEAIVNAIRDVNKEQYAASGFIHTGLQHKDTASIKGINEGLWTYIHESDSYRQSLRLGRLRANANSVGTSKEDFAVMNVAGFTSVLFSGVNDGFQIKFPDAPNGTVVYDSSGNCRGTGKPTLDLSKEVDPKYGDVADSVNEAVARAFEGELGNGDFRNGLTGWAFANGLEIIPNHSVGVTRFNIKTAGNGQCNNDSANNRLVRGLKYKATIYVADSSGTFFLSTLKDSAIDQQHALKNGWNEIEFTMGDSLYPVRKGNAQAGQYIDIGFFSVTALTEEVVIERVDMAGLEFFKEKVGAYLYPYGMIQSKATTVDGVATTEDTVRPITYFAVFEGDTTSRGRGWKLADLTFVQLATIMSNPEHNVWYNEAGELMQFRGRQRSFAGLGNGDWGATNIGIHPAKDRYLGFTTNTFVHSQGMLNTVTQLNSITNRIYESNVSGYTEEAGVYKVNNGSGATAVDDECYFYVLATVPRLNQGAYHQSLNPMGTKHWNRHDASGGNFWHQPHTGNNKTTARAFYQTIVVGETGARQPTGAIGQNSGRGDGRLYDAIYASGQGGVIDWRLPARDMSSKEEAAKIFQKVVNGSYRGLEKLTRSKPFLTTHQAAVKQSSGTLIYIDGAFEFLTKGVPKNDGAWLNLRCNGYIISQASSNANGNYIYIHNCEGDVAAEFPLGTAVVLTTDETNLSVSGEFTQLDVVGAPADILRVDDLNNGWMGGWVPVVPVGAVKQFPYTRKNVGISGIGTDAVVSTNQGSTWASSGISTSPNTQNIFGGSGQSIQDGLVYVAPYKAFAKQTKLSVNKPVLNGSEGIGDVFATTRGHQDDGVLFAESLISKVLTSTSAPYSQILSFYGSRFGSDGKIAQHPTAGEHVKLGIAVPTNNSPSVKALWHQASNNQQATLNLLWNELIFDTNWRTPDKVWSGGSVSVAVGETFRAESSSAYAVAGLLMRCVKAVTANATVLGAMHVSEGGDVISLSDGQTYFKVVNNGWSDDSTIRIIDGVGTFNNENGDTCLYGISELAMPYGYTKNQAGAGKQVVGVDL
ncbi:hypothetical protein [Vibrio vulnificus]|uniref:hypothetical protein n=1 Tax=Vibrio vulnificus TaxID=672 RepID=UPI001CDCE59F|nr:hypothetical protein [Vibrio vulnificus]MCA3989534.1 hypothetical protein [Vibrio vulnificus]